MNSLFLSRCHNDLRQTTLKNDGPMLTGLGKSLKRKFLRNSRLLWKYLRCDPQTAEISSGKAHWNSRCDFCQQFIEHCTMIPYYYTAKKIKKNTIERAMRSLAATKLHLILYPLIAVCYILLGCSTAQFVLYRLVVPGPSSYTISQNKSQDPRTSEQKLPIRRHLPLIKRLITECTLRYLYHQRTIDDGRGYYDPQLLSPLLQCQLSPSIEDRAPPVEA